MRLIYTPNAVDLYIELAAKHGRSDTKNKGTFILDDTQAEDTAKVYSRNRLPAFTNSYKKIVPSIRGKELSAKINQIINLEDGKFIDIMRGDA